MTDKKSKLDHRWLTVIVASLLALILLLMPTPEGLTSVAQKSMALFVFALIMWIARPIPIYQTSIVLVLLLPLIGAVKDQSSAFGALGFDIIWLMVAAFVLTSAMSATNLGKRIALSLTTRFAKTPTQVLVIFVIVNYILAFFVPSTTARASLIVPIALVILEVYQELPGESKFGKLMMLQGIQNNAFATSVIMTATSAQVLAVGFINEQTGAKIGYLQWMMGAIPQALLTTLFAFFVGLKLYTDKDKSKEKLAQATAVLKQQLEDMGPLSKNEKKALGIFLITLLLWATGDYQQAWLGFHISTEQTAVLSMLLCLLPGIGVIKWKEANIKWDLMIFSAGAYAIGKAVDKSGAATWTINHLVSMIGLDQINPSFVAVILIFITIFSHLIFTSKTVRTTILIPAIITLAKQLGIDPAPLALVCSFGIATTITLPPHSKVNTLYFGTGYFTIKDELVYGLVSCFIASCALCLVYFTWIRFVI
ncbi:SLC13 family permease [Aerococcus christensenii]|uniref:SLC13 family permease n=1 Tax=Aerococcus christensenii TaxID=87541 RepID=UPI0023A98E7C|nr:DASS family sodium-coupled anion symporter [Aerococcus christensenii]WEB70346.1 DASS family sodium-coupled anion symporter [Aerococcus christensenii]